MTQILAALALTMGEALALVTIVLMAGIVRGFTGFALSAFVMALAVLILPPVEVSPVLFWLELAASVLMLRTGWHDGDRRAAAILVGGATVGGFAGIGATMVLDPGVSRIVALVILIALAALQLARLRLPGLTTVAGTTAVGLVSGAVTGLAGVGGMVVVLYVLARDDEPRVMRSTLVMYLAGTVVTGLAALLWWGTMTPVAALRGVALIPVCLLGVWLGMKLFTPRWQRLYRPLSLSLLLGLATLALLRTVL
jgi:hypothetical protein